MRGIDRGGRGCMGSLRCLVGCCLLSYSYECFQTTDSQVKSVVKCLTGGRRDERTRRVSHMLAKKDLIHPCL